MLSVRTIRVNPRIRVPHPRRAAAGWGIARSAIVIAVTGALASSAHAQALGTINHPITLTVCELTHHYQSYAGKFVSFRATLKPGYEIAVYYDGSCRSNLPIEDPDDSLIKPKPHFHIRKDASFQKYDNTTVDPPFVVNDNWPVTTYKLTATYTGRLDVASPGTLGYGHLGHSRMRLVLLSVSDVVATVSHKATLPPTASGSIQVVPSSPPNVYPAGSPQQ